ncbi:phosphoenolpyruvate synthase [Chitinophaga tropicalis]|uniref:Phosphoenolpyruvate synthase n=1 Tax=Chitinophaga tropicalis TaxID=2683588 RepID=A0A7K1U300_9BACT|nr:phosphoenolpyruvate synthase [Chitinophaga tropicalis]MVT08728.1 phosphoenolpyruvate synthase [Chitinophaga tropicalis]
MEPFVKNFNDISIKDVATVGGKNASIGEMINCLSGSGINIPGGFAITAFAWWTFLDFNNLWEPLEKLMSELDRRQFSNLKDIGAAARKIVLGAEIPAMIRNAIKEEYVKMATDRPAAVAVRSSATAEDMPYASFAGQHESFLNIRDEDAVVDAVHRCYSSLFTDRAIKYREDNGIEHKKVALCTCIQKMVRSDLACSGVAFTLEPESGFRDVILLSGSWGLGENIVQGSVEPDEFCIFKPALRAGKQAIIQKKIGLKHLTMNYSNETGEIINMPTPDSLRSRQVLDDQEILQLAGYCLAIEEHYKCPMDIEWAKDGLDGKMYIVQARPETVHSRKVRHEQYEYRLLEKGRLLVSGQAIGTKVATGVVRVLNSPAAAGELKQGEIIVTRSTSPDWDPVLKKAGAIITDTGGRTSHAAIVAREQDVPAIVGCSGATAKLQTGMQITVDCSEGKTGYVYEGALPFEKIETDLSCITMPSGVKPLLIMSDPGKAFKLAAYPSAGVGLLRMEFIITHTIGIHPMALLNYSRLADETTRKTISRLTQQFTDKTRFFVERLSQGIATIAAAFYPREVIVRTSDFKTNEYASLLGGKEFEPLEENPMLGFRGASRYYHPAYKEAFGLECAAIREVRENMGLVNVKVMIPFCRTVAEGKKVLSVMEEYGLERGRNELEVYAMAEIPSNVLQAEQFAEIFDGFSIGSNDLTQLTLGIDRDSRLVSGLFSEEDPAVKSMLSLMLKKAKKAHRPVGLCGQAPSDIPGFAAFLVNRGITSIAFNPDALLKGIKNINEAEQELQAVGPKPMLQHDHGEHKIKSI